MDTALFKFTRLAYGHRTQEELPIPATHADKARTLIARGCRFTVEVLGNSVAGITSYACEDDEADQDIGIMLVQPGASDEAHLAARARMIDEATAANQNDD